MTNCCFVGPIHSKSELLKPLVLKLQSPAVFGNGSDDFLRYAFLNVGVDLQRYRDVGAHQSGQMGDHFVCDTASVTSYASRVENELPWNRRGLCGGAPELAQPSSPEPLRCSPNIDGCLTSDTSTNRRLGFGVLRGHLLARGFGPNDQSCASVDAYVGSSSKPAIAFDMCLVVAVRIGKCVAFPCEQRKSIGDAVQQYL